MRCSSKWAGLAKCLFVILLSAMSLQARPWILLFGSEGCEECAEIKSLWQEQSETDRPVLVYISIDKAENYAFLKEVEKTLHVRRPGASFPIVLMGRKMGHGVEGFMELYSEMEELLEFLPKQALFHPIQKLADETDGCYATWNVEIAEKNKTQIVENAGQYRLLFLSSPGCKKCARQAVELKLLGENLPGLQLEEFEVTTEIGQIYLDRVVRHFAIDGDSKNLAPIVIWNAGYITGRLAEEAELKEALLKGDTTAKPFWDEAVSDADYARLKARQSGFLSNMTWTAAVLAGLVDGINPCAFATVIFLISYLLMLKRSRRFILATGLCFCLGVFLSYFMFGIGLSYVVNYLNRFRFIKLGIYFIFAAVGVFFSIMHFRDALRFRRSGKESDMDMRLDKDTHRKIHSKIHAWGRMSSWLMWPGAVLLGVVISSMEFVCTGQIYLPTIMAINSSGFNMKAFWGLLVYNTAFILPLLGVALLAYAGIGANFVAEVARKHLVVTKTIMAVLFLLLAVLMVLIAILGH